MQRAHRIRLWRRDDLSAEGISARAVRTHVRDGLLIAVRPGVFVWTAEVAPLSPEERTVIRARALQLTSQNRPVFSHVTAAALWGLPLHGPRTREVHVVASEGRPGAAIGTVRHDGPLAEHEIVEIDGMLCTSLARTVADAARTTPYATAVCIADAALRTVAHAGPGRYDEAAAAEFRGISLEAARRRVHGVRRAESVLAFADGRAQLPGESVSRIHLVQLGFVALRLQVHVAGPDGGDFWVDFGLDDVWAFGEFDGKGKYRDRLLLAGLSMQEALEREKQREDWIRGTTQRRFARWGAEHNRNALELGDRLASFGLIPPRRPVRFA